MEANLEEKKIEDELKIKKEELPDEKTEMQVTIDKLRKENQDYQANAGRVPDLQRRIDSLEGNMEEKINSLLTARQPGKEEESTPIIDDDDYISGKRAKQLINDAAKASAGSQEEVVKKVLQEEKGEKAQYDKEYLKEVARLSMDIKTDGAFQGILKEMDTNFRDDSKKDPREQAELNYAKAKASYLSKEMAAGNKVEFGRNETPVSSLAVGHRGGERPVKREEKDVEPESDDAKQLLATLQPDPEKRKKLAKEALV